MHPVYVLAEVMQLVGSLPYDVTRAVLPTYISSCRECFASVVTMHWSPRGVWKESSYRSR
jgi:hypothetical protein